MRETHDLLPNLALEKHAIIGAGLIWRRIYGGPTCIRPQQKKEGDVPETTPWKALPLIPVWDKAAVPTYQAAWRVCVHECQQHDKPGNGICGSKRGLWYEDQADGSSIYAVTTESARDWSDKDFNGHSEGDGSSRNHILSPGVDRSSNHAGVCASGS